MVNSEKSENNRINLNGFIQDKIQSYKKNKIGISLPSSSPPSKYFDNTYNQN
jgi:hypothetical protein